MRLQPQLYVDTSGNPLGEPVFERVEFFDFESIELNSSIQDVRDIAKVFTDYSQGFSVPASKKNNKIFKHYYNVGVIDGFDARIKQKAEIHLNGMLFKSGFVRLSQSSIKRGKPKSYRLTFFGGLSSLKNVIGDTELSELSTLDKYNHDYTRDNVHNGFIQGLGLSGADMVASDNRDIVYPSISVNDKWYYDSSNVSGPIEFKEGVSRNIYNPNTDGEYGILYTNLKPAIKVKHIITAIEDKYESIDFSDDFFGTAEFDNLYMLLHKNKGRLEPTSLTNYNTSITYRVGSSNEDSDFELDSGYEEQRPMLTKWDNVGLLHVDVQQYHIIPTVTVLTPASNSSYTITILDGPRILNKSENLSGTQSLTAVLCTRDAREWDDIRVMISSNGDLTTFELDLEIKQVRYRMSAFLPPSTICDVSNYSGTPDTLSSFYSTPDATQTFGSEVDITANMPKIKIIDFLKGIYNAFNLTAYVDDNNVIVVKPLSEYYDTGNTIDITSMIDNEDIAVKRMPLFKNIEFKYKEPKTFGTINKNEISQVEFGNLEYESTANGTASNLVFDGKDYKVSLPFEKVYFERLRDEDSATDQTLMGNGWLVDKDQNEVVTSPILFYNIVQDVDTSKYQIGFLNENNLVSRYNRASNTNAELYWNGSAFVTVQGTKSLNFGSEFDEFTLSEVGVGSLFNKYYSEYIATVFDRGTRVFELDMKADLAFLLNYELNDTLLIEGEQFIINNIRTNLTTGITKLELILKFDITAAAAPIGGTLTAPTGLSQLFFGYDKISFNWNANPTDQNIKGYKIYVDSVLTDTILLYTSYTLSGLSANTSYSIQVSAYDSQNNESALSSAVSMSTQGADTEPPTAPTNLVSTSVTDLSIGISWNASTDNVGVTGYEVFLDSVLNQTVTSTTATILGLSSNTTYDIQVRAKDGAGNESGFSNLLQVRTL